MGSGGSAEDERDAASIASLEAGGLPLSATERLAEARAGGGVWASDLSVAELAAIRHVGFDPIGLVLGSAIYKIGAQWGGAYRGGAIETFGCPHGYYHEGMRNGYNWEHTIYEQGLAEARDRAMGRLLAEATALGAHGVVGVRLEFKHGDRQGQLVEFSAVGTAIRRHGAPPLERPFTSLLSGQDFAKLITSGHVPAALVVGIAAIEMDAGCGVEAASGSWWNVELTQFTSGVQLCRDLAVRRLEQDAARFGDSVVGVDLRFSIREVYGESRLVELVALGTAVRRFSESAMTEPPLVMMRIQGP